MKNPDIDTVCAAVRQFVNKYLKDSACCPSSGAIGECAAIFHLRTFENGDERFEAMVYINIRDFQDDGLLAHWFHQAGCSDVTVAHTIYCDTNEVRNGYMPDGSRQVAVGFTAKLCA